MSRTLWHKVYESCSHYDRALVDTNYFVWDRWQHTFTVEPDDLVSILDSAWHLRQASMTWKMTSIGHRAVQANRENKNKGREWIKKKYNSSRMKLVKIWTYGSICSSVTWKLTANKLNCSFPMECSYLTEPFCFSIKLNKCDYECSIGRRIASHTIGRQFESLEGLLEHFNSYHLCTIDKVNFENILR